MDDWLAKHLACPRDHKSLRLEGNTLICLDGHRYPYIDGIPVMLLTEAGITDGEYLKTVRCINSGQYIESPDNKTHARDTVDPFVQKAIGGTSGIMFKSLIHNLRFYPIPDMPLQESSGKYLLDIGCNWGRWCIAAARKGYKPVGVDSNLEAIMAARRIAEQLGISACYVVGDARHLPFARGTFDAAFSYSVLQHFSKSDVRLILSGISRDLKEGGFSLIQMPNVFGLRSIYNQLKRCFKETVPFDVRYWRISELRRAFSEAIGDTFLSVDGFFSLNAQLDDMKQLPFQYGLVVKCSDRLKRLSVKIPWMKFFADSVYVKSIKRAS